MAYYDGRLAEIKAFSRDQIGHLDPRFMIYSPGNPYKDIYFLPSNLPLPPNLEKGSYDPNNPPELTFYDYKYDPDPDFYEFLHEPIRFFFLYFSEQDQLTKDNLVDEWMINERTKNLLPESEDYGLDGETRYYLVHTSDRRLYRFVIKLLKSARFDMEGEEGIIDDLISVVSFKHEMLAEDVVDISHIEPTTETIHHQILTIEGRLGLLYVFEEDEVDIKWFEHPEPGKYFARLANIEECFAAIDNTGMLFYNFAIRREREREDNRWIISKVPIPDTDIDKVETKEVQDGNVRHYLLLVHTRSRKLYVSSSFNNNMVMEDVLAYLNVTFEVTNVWTGLCFILVEDIHNNIYMATMDLSTGTMISYNPLNLGQDVHLFPPVKRLLRSSRST